MKSEKKAFNDEDMAILEVVIIVKTEEFPPFNLSKR